MLVGRSVALLCCVPSAGLILGAGLMLSACSNDERKGAPPADQDRDGPEGGGISKPSDPAGADDAGSGRGDDDDTPSDPPDAAASLPDAGLRPPPFDGGPRLADGAPSYCGDGVRDPEFEVCDPAGPLPLGCPDVGFSGGEMRCDDDCQLDTSACTGDELCADGRDNDGDGLVDCIDDDCADACTESCASAVRLDGSPVGVPQRVEGTTFGHASELEASCSAIEGGAEVVYRYVPTSDGVLEVSLESASLLLASARTRCGDAEAEVACGLIGADFDVAIVEGEPIFLVVDGYDDVEQGGFVMFLNEREVACGNGTREGGERCDDGNQNDGDGCSNACELNPAEAEPNDDAESANDYRNPHYAEIAPSTDVDFTRFELAEASSVRARVLELGDGGCAALTMDPLLRLFDASLELVAQDDDSGEGYCAEVALTLEAGAYLAEVTRATAGSETFPYRLVLTFGPAP